MAAEQAKPQGPDLTQGVSLDQLADGGMLGGHVGDEAVLLARRGDEIFAIGATCTHYSGPLAEGLMVDDTVRCPWHHACFSLRTGEAIGAPAFNPVSCWRVEKRDGKVLVRDKVEPPRPLAKATGASDASSRIVIVGGGAAGFAAAETLRREGFSGSLTMVSADDAAPYDRPNCSKDYLAGNAPEEWMPLRPDDWYQEHAIELMLRTEVTGIDVRAREVALAGGKSLRFDKLLLATGAEPIRLSFMSLERPHVRLLRSLADSRAIVAHAKEARRAVVIGASFIGLEVAAALRAREIETHVVAPERRPLERILGPEFGDFVRSLHEEKGVVFHLGDAVKAVDDKQATLESGGKLDADLVVVGVGVRPRTQLAERAGFEVDGGVLVNEYLETGAPGIFAAGDIAKWPDRHSGEALRIEHWVVAERQGQAAARNMLGRREAFAEVPFFWSQHYDVPINYVGHAAKWDRLEIDGDIKGRDCVVRYRAGGKVRAVASIYRDVDSLKAEVEMERAG
jgi:NADPH-dependent 2,4-dienoyl-CoA reductase/sulfur reductase-like enzyme/nitrite reductase/ring-hydroxylating ferredoxin subunit